jgi:hypothetical protein
MKTAWWFVVVVVALALPARAYAFSDPMLFGEGVDKGGGDGRYFTGSRVDGYACSVCHRGGAAPTFIVDGIPDSPVAGTRYELVIHWPDPETPHALQLELTTPSGASPSVAITPAAMLPAESRCDGLPTGLPAVYSVDLGVRRIVGVEDCHAASVTVSFVATGEPIELAIGGITSDEAGDVEGDGTYELRTTIGEHLVATGGGGCNASGGDVGLLFAIALITVARRRRAP